LKVKYILLWLAGVILYGISWPMPWAINLSFLSWFALVFLFVTLEKARNFWRYLGIVWVFSFLTHTICSGWFLDIPTNKMLIVVGAINESLNFPLPFIIFYFIKKRLGGFSKAIFILPFLFVVTEWLYSTLPHNLGYLMVVHSQTENLWLLQYADLFGFLSVTFWVILFNVLLYYALVKAEYRLFSVSFVKRAVPFVLIMLALPLTYAIYRDRQIKQQKPETLDIAMINTRFPPNRKNAELLLQNLDRTIELTDSLDYFSKKKQQRHDLFVWHEGAVPDGNNRQIMDYIQNAVHDWQTPLLTGVKYFVEFDSSGNRQPLNRVVLLLPNPAPAESLQYYDKINLAPGWESIPYLSLFHKLGIHFSGEYKYHKRGDKLKLFELPLGDRVIHFGAPICFEQNVPAIWNHMVKLGADCFVLISFESWFGNTYFQKQVAYITRLRAIETRHSIARCSNGGMTFFVDAFGRIYAPAPRSESVSAGSLALSDTVTFYTRHQYLFPLLCLVVSLVTVLYAWRRGRPRR